MVQLASLQRPSRARRHRRGYIEASLPFMFIVILMMVGLVFDAGSMLVEKREALNASGTAARAGAMELDILHYRQTGQVRIDQELASGEISGYVTSQGFNLDSVSYPSAVSVQVSVSTTWEPSLLSFFGVGPRAVDGSALATLQSGTDS